MSHRANRNSNKTVQSQTEEAPSQLSQAGIAQQIEVSMTRPTGMMGQIFQPSICPKDESVDGLCQQVYEYVGQCIASRDAESGDSGYGAEVSNELSHLVRS